MFYFHFVTKLVLPFLNEIMTTLEIIIVTVVSTLIVEIILIAIFSYSWGKNISTEI